MPDTDHVAESLPENPGLTVPANEPIEPASSTAQTSFVEKVGRAAESVFESAGLPFRRGRGRPANCKGCGRPETKCRCDKLAAKADIEPVATAAPSPALAAVPLAATVDNTKNRSLLSRSIVSVVKGAVNFGRSKILSKLKQADLETPTLLKCYEETDPEKETALADFSESLELCFEKYKVNTEYAPEIACLCSAGRIFTPIITMNQTLDAEIKARAKREALKGETK